MSSELPDTTAGCPAESSSISAALLIGLCLPGLLVFLVPTPAGMTASAHRLVAVAVVMAGLWMTQAIPMAATSLLPLALFPLLGIQSSIDTAKSFVEDSLFLYLGGMLIALGIERWGLHRRIALGIISVAGVSPRRMVIGFSLATFFLSMWISNTATTMLMLPIGLAMLRVVEDEDSATGRGRAKQLSVPLLLALAYSSTLGGMATLVGSPTNSVAIGIYRKQLPDAPDIYFSEWLLACGPIAMFYLAVVVGSLVWKLPQTSSQDRALRNILTDRMKSLGKMSVAERRMAWIFVSTALLWILREPLVFGSVTVFSGWQSLLARIVGAISSDENLPATLLARGAISDATVSIFMSVLIFILPSGERDVLQRQIPLMDWSTATKLPWDMILLFGGGFALASAFESTHLAGWIASSLQGPLSSQPAWIVVAVVCMILVLLTELTSNVATINAILPALLALAAPLNLDPRMLFVPATLAASAGFMLPVGTPPNAIVFSTGRIPAAEMARRGLLLNLVGVPILTIGTWLLIRPILGIP
ncbi:MAG: SLC13 family permease [Planctomycetia bacterium]